MRAAWIAAAGTLALDQASKLWVIHVLELPRRLAIDVLPPYFNLRMAWNTGVNFGLFAGEAAVTRWVLVALALAIAAGVWIWVRRQRPRPVVHVAAGLLVGGALGNVIDRLLHGAVADFINMSCCGLDNPYAFNIADVAIFAGAFGLLLFGGQDDGRDGGAPEGREGGQEAGGKGCRGAGPSDGTEGPEGGGREGRGAGAGPVSGGGRAKTP